MSTINLKGATSGTLSLVPPAIAGTNTITFPAETGTARTTVSSGTVLQVVNYQTGAVASGTTIIPIDDTIPQNTEGDEYMTLAITPRSATSRLFIRVVVNFTTNGGTSSGSAALFQDSTANALSAAGLTIAGSNYLGQIIIEHVMTSGTTSSTTFKVRGGPAGAFTFILNGSSGAVRYFAGVFATSITITEVVP